MFQSLSTADQGRPWMALGMKPLAGSAQHQAVTGRTGKQADRQAIKLSGMQPVGGSSSGSSSMEARCRLAFEPAMRTGSKAGMRPVTYAGMQTGKPSYRPEGRRPQLRAAEGVL